MFKMSKRKLIIDHSDYYNSDEENNPSRIVRHLSPALDLIGGQVVTRSAAKQPKLIIDHSQYLNSDDENEDTPALKKQLPEPVVPEPPDPDPTEEANAGEIFDDPPGSPQVDHLHPTSSEYDRDTIVVGNDAVEAHIYETFHRHQKIFQ